MAGAICGCLIVATAAAVDAAASEIGLLGMLKEWGPAGLIAAMWLFERRDARKRNHQLDEAHKRILADAKELEVLVGVVKNNTEASTRLADVIEKLAERREEQRA